jgi:hypothetical protein
MGLPGRSLAVLRRGVYFLFHNARRALKALVVVWLLVLYLYSTLLWPDTLGDPRLPKNI